MAHDEEELLIIAKYLDKIGVKFIIQEYVKAQECTIGVVVSKSYRVMGSISVLREVRSGFSYRMVVKDIKEARDISERIALKLGVTGPLNVQLFITDEGPVIFEMNPRFSGTTPIRSAVGFNEVDGVLRNFLYGEEIQLSFRPNITAIRYLDEVYAYSSTLDELQREGCTEKKGWRKNYF
jgi:carbamoyl-phosphate synthase large subunit